MDDDGRRECDGEEGDEEGQDGGEAHGIHCEEVCGGGRVTWGRRGERSTGSVGREGRRVPEEVGED